MWQLGEEAAQVGVHAEGQCIEPLGPIEGHRGHALVDLEGEVLPGPGEPGRRPEGAHFWRPPPSRTMLWPLMAPEPGWARKATAWATSAGSSNLPNGTMLASRSRALSSSMPVLSPIRLTVLSVIGVST